MSAEIVVDLTFLQLLGFLGLSTLKSECIALTSAGFSHCRFLFIMGHFSAFSVQSNMDPQLNVLEKYFIISREFLSLSRG